MEQIELTSLLRNRALLNRDERVPSGTRPVHGLGVVEFHGMFVPHPVIDQLIEENKRRIKSSEAKGSIQSARTEEMAPTFYHHVSQVVRRVDGVEAVYASIFERRRVIAQREADLAGRYCEIASIWNECCIAIDCLNILTQGEDDSTVWGPEQKMTPTKPYSGRAVTQDCAWDVPMLLDPVDRQAYCFNNTSALVKDPTREHRVLGHGASWTPEEQKIFVDKFLLHPKKFRYIAQCLPNRTVKDVVEYYYLTKSHGSLPKRRKGKRSG